MGIFGDGLRAAPSSAPAAWLVEQLSLRPWTVGGLLPEHYDAYLAIDAAPDDVDDWWTAQSAIVTALAEVLVDHTTTPDRAWFAIWEGHGFDGGSLMVMRSEPGAPADPAGERAIQAAVDEHERSVGEVRSALAVIPAFMLPTRRYFLLAGQVLGVERLRWPLEPSHWFRPDLWWPDDRSWFVGTDVDFWTTFVGGTREAMADVAARVPSRCRPATLDEPLPHED